MAALPHTPSAKIAPEYVIELLTELVGAEAARAFYFIGTDADKNDHDHQLIHSFVNLDSGKYVRFNGAGKCYLLGFLQGKSIYMPIRSDKALKALPSRKQSQTKSLWDRLWRSW